MTGRPVVAILTDPGDRFSKRRYLLKLLISGWQNDGFDVRVTNPETPFVPATVAFLHTDLTVIPDSLIALGRRYSRCVNLSPPDIRKSRIGSDLLTADSRWNGPVIVKTDFNAGGGQEFALETLTSMTGRIAQLAGLDKLYLKLRLKIDNRRCWSKRRVLGFSQYPIFAKIGAVPAGVWRNPRLVVEKFQPERDGDFFCCRHWLFLGRAEVVRRTKSKGPIVKVGDCIEPLNEPVPQEIRAIRARLGLDYGKIDYAMVNGCAVLYDVNRTPGAHRDPRHHSNTVATLAPAIREFLL